MKLILDGVTRPGKTIAGYRDRLQKHFKVKELKTSKNIKDWNRGELL